MKKSARLSTVLLFTLMFATSFLLTATLFAGSIPLATNYGWESSTPGGSTYGGNGQVSTGAGLADIDRDGWLDLVVADGNDIEIQNVVVYYNTGTGTFPTTPDWFSSDADYHGHLSLGDVNNDGWIDVAVSVFIGQGGFSQKGYVKVYRNVDGTFESTPYWNSSDYVGGLFYNFSCSLGDADSDGDLDLAVATGEAYFNPPDRDRIYYNLGGGNFESTPSWLSDEIAHSMDAAWGDIDGDGDLDLAFTTSGGPNRIYLQDNGVLPTTADWTSTGSPQDGNSMVLGDVNRDGGLDLVVANNDQLGGDGSLAIYLNNGSGPLVTTPSWTSTFNGYGAGAALADLDGDLYPELASGAWWGNGRVYDNSSGSYASTQDWSSSVSLVVEAEAFGDVDRDGLRARMNETHAGDGSRTVFYLDRWPAEALLQVRMDGNFVGPGAYCYDLASGWISLYTAPSSEIIFDYLYSDSRDLVISNWESSNGNYLFYHDPVSPVLIPRWIPRRLNYYWPWPPLPLDLGQPTFPSKTELD